MTRYELLRLRLESGDEPVSVRHLAGRAARLLGLEDLDATRVGASVSEIMRFVGSGTPVVVTLDAVVRATAGAPFGAGDGTHAVLEISFESAAFGASGVVPGDPVHTVLARLMDGVHAEPELVRVAKTLPAALGEPALRRVRDQLLIDPPGGLRAFVEIQNTELVAAVLALREREAELVLLNGELEQTNRGVVALYNELERRANEVRAVHRIVFEELEHTLRPLEPTVPGLEFGVRYLPAQVGAPTGGDLYDWLVLPDGTVHIAVVDVQGHGVAGTRDALSVTHVLRILTLEGHGLAELIARADAVLQATDKVVATAFVARFDPRSGELELTGAGHPPSLRFGVEGEPEFLETTGRPFGYPQRAGGEVVRTRLAPGDCLVMYTDGLVEIRRDILEGLDTLHSAVGKARGLPMAQFLDTVLGACTQGDPLRDDTLLLAMRWTPPPAPAALPSAGR